MAIKLRIPSLQPCNLAMLCLLAPLTEALAQERVVFTAMPLATAKQRFAVKSPSGQAVPLQTLNAERTRYAGVHHQDQRGGTIEIGSLEAAASAPRRVDLSPRQGLHVVGFVGDSAVLVTARQTDKPARLGCLIVEDRVVDLELPSLAKPNSRVLRQALVIQHDQHGPWIAAMALSIRQDFETAQNLWTLGRFDASGSPTNISEVPLAKVLPGLDRPERAIRWLDPARRAVMLAGSPRLWMLGRSDVLTWVRWEDPELVVPALQPTERFLTLAPSSPQTTDPQRSYGVTLQDGTILGSFSCSDTARIAVWRTPLDPEQPGKPEALIPTEVPLWLVHPHDPRRARKVVLDCGDDLLLIGASLLHNGIPNEVVGLVDLRAEPPHFVPLLAANNIITLGEATATAKRKEDGRIELLLTLSSQYGEHLLLPLRADGRLEDQ